MRDLSYSQSHPSQRNLPKEKYFLLIPIPILPNKPTGSPRLPFISARITCLMEPVGSLRLPALSTQAEPIQRKNSVVSVLATCLNCPVSSVLFSYTQTVLEQL